MVSNNKLNKISAVSAIVFNTALLLGAFYFFSVTAQGQEQESQMTTEINLFEDMSGEIINGSKHVGFTFNLTEPGVNELLWEDNKILFNNGRVLLS